MKKILTILCAVTLVMGLTACSGESTEPSSTTESEVKETSQVVYEDDTLSVTFKGVSDVAGQIGLNFTLENKSSEEITVIPLDSSVNGTMVQFTSGTLATIQGGKTFNQVWLCNPETIGISKSNEVKSIEFSLDFGSTTDIIEIELK